VLPRPTDPFTTRQQQDAQDPADEELRLLVQQHQRQRDQQEDEGSYRAMQVSPWRAPHRGVVVHRFGLEEMVQLYDMREVNEGLCARLAARHVGPETWDGLIELFDEPMAKIVRDKQFDAYSSHYERLRKALIDAAASPPLAELLRRMLDPNEFLSDHGVRALSRYHAEHPYTFSAGGQEYRVAYLPAESDSGMFGGNSNWRGPIWMPVNALIIRALLHYYSYYGENFKIECPIGSGKLMNLFEVAREIGMRKVIVPFAPGVFSAFGMLFADLRYDFVRTWFTPLDDASFDDIEAVYRALERLHGRGLLPLRVTAHIAHAELDEALADGRATGRSRGRYWRTA